MGRGRLPGPDHVDVFTAKAEDNDGTEATDTDDATVDFTNVAPSVTLDKTVTPASYPEPGGIFSYNLKITNTSPEDVTITSLTDTNGAADASLLPYLGKTMTPGEVIEIPYTVQHTDTGIYQNAAAVSVVDNDGSPASAQDAESVSVTDVLPTVDLTKEVSPASMTEPGGVFTFTLTITNTSVEPVAITSLTDDNPLSDEVKALVGTILGAGEWVSVSYPVTHTEAGLYKNTASVTVKDNEGNAASDTDSESVEVTDVLPTVDSPRTSRRPRCPSPAASSLSR